MNEENYRGRCFSTKGKRTKTGELKRAGNFSRATFHSQQLQFKDYYVRLRTYESGIQTLIVGDHTPLAQIMGETVATLAMRDEHFDLYQQKGEYTRIGNKRVYEAFRMLRKNSLIVSWRLDPHAFTYREMIYTEGDFKYNFPEY